MADIYILNTCTVTQAADRESRHTIGLFHRTNPNAKIVVSGCYAERNADDISFLPGVEHILKNSEKNRIAEVLDDTPRSALRALRSAPSREPLFITDFKDHTRAFVKIQDGCENACAYCKVPLVRGRLKSRSLEDVLREVRG